MTFVVAVVDDDARVLESLENLLESAGYRVHLFSAARELLERMAFADIDCLITDISMPVMDGFELQRLAHRARPELPVILITGHEFPSEITVHRHPGRFFGKPFNGQELLAAVGSALDRAGGCD